jgi:thiamine-monophosphate kinase
MRAMLVRDVGEFDLIEMLAKTLEEEGVSSPGPGDRNDFRLRVSVGDDAAAWDAPAGVTVLSTDALVEGVHFALERTNWADLGWKSLAVNLSDVAAMGCAPQYSVISLGLRGDLPVEGLLDMYRGMAAVCRRHGGKVVGGDVVRSPVLFLAVATVGAARQVRGNDDREPPLLTRDSAVPGDKIAVTGSLGCSGGGLRMMLQGPSLDDKTAAHLRDAHNRPSPRVAEGMLLAEHGVLAAIDISDGLVDDLGKLCESSGVGGIVHAARVPADEYLRRAYPEEWISLALSGGEDYELLFTAPARVMDDLTSALDGPVSVIGDIVDGPPGVRVLDQGGRDVPVEQGGWDHFARCRSQD